MTFTARLETLFDAGVTGFKESKSICFIPVQELAVGDPGTLRTQIESKPPSLHIPELVVNHALLSLQSCRRVVRPALFAPCSAARSPSRGARAAAPFVSSEEATLSARPR